MSGRHTRGAVVGIGLLLIAILLSACGNGVKKAAPSATTTPGVGSKPVADVPGLGTGVTAKTIKLGVVLIDYKCLPANAVSSVYVNQPQAYNAYIDNINEHGGINGRKIVPVFKTVCPVPVSLTLAACTSLTEDSHVFAVVGAVYDPDGTGRLCIAKQHKTVLITDGVTQQWINEAPPGLLLSPGITPDRQLRVVMALVKQKHLLDGKKVAILTENTSQNVADTVVEPALKSMGVERGATASLTLSGFDTTAAQTQLSSFIEKWKIEKVNALILVGPGAEHDDFINKIKAAIPDMQLIAGDTSVSDGGQSDVQRHIVPNPYDGIITAEGRIHLEHSQTPHYTYCKNIYEKQTGIKIPLPNVVVKLPNGQHNNIYGNAEDACSYVTMFQDIAEHVGKDLNNANWTTTVNNLGPVKVMNTDWATLHTGKYDADDTYGLVAFDPTIPPLGDWRHVTPTENVGKF